MALSFEWEEWVFRAISAMWTRVRPARPGPRLEAARFEAERTALTVLAGTLAGGPVRLVAARAEGGVREGDLLLPATIDIGGDAALNRQVLLVRIAVGATLHRLAIPGDALVAARAATVLLDGELPAFGELFRAVVGRLPLAEDAWGRECRDALDLDRPFVRGEANGPLPIVWGALFDGTRGAPGAGAGELARPGGTDRKARNVDQVEHVAVDEERAREKVLQHTFEKVETLDEHRGQVQKLDGTDELDEQLEALDELDLQQVIRGGERAESLYRAETGLDASIPDVNDELPGETAIPYDEWAGDRYRRGWCSVYPSPMGAGEPAWGAGVLATHRRQIDELHRRLQVHRTRRTPERRQRDGEELDLDAVVDAVAERLAGRGGSDRLYLRRRRNARSFATTVLLDVSLSTDAWVGNRRVLDVARESILVLGEVAERLGDPLQVLAFASHTRNRCRVWSVREWGEPWSVGRARLGALRPQGYTRIGPAIRHATAELVKVPADRHLLLLVSDGKPTDYDRYEGKYGVADVRHALREGEAKGVVTHALAIDAFARDHLPAMLGPGAWHILPDPARLPEVLTTVYGRLTAA
jgi:nitric oxide reductase NorD protein